MPLVTTESNKLLNRPLIRFTVKKFVSTPVERLKAKFLYGVRLTVEKQTCDTVSLSARGEEVPERPRTLRSGRVIS